MNFGMTINLMGENKMKYLIVLIFSLISLSAFSQNSASNDSLVFETCGEIHSRINKTLEQVMYADIVCLEIVDDYNPKPPTAPVDMYIRHYFGLGYWG